MTEAYEVKGIDRSKMSKLLGHPGVKEACETMAQLNKHELDEAAGIINIILQARMRHRQKHGKGESHGGH
jgi:hypothetical protein